jgi:hypothetical protein
MPMNPRLLRPRATGFNPKSLAGLIAWYDASDASTITTSTGVSEWRDKSGLGRKLSQNSGSNQPALVSSGIGGKPSLDFTAASSHFMFGAFSQSLSAVTTFVVAEMRTGTQSNGRALGFEVAGQFVDFSGTGHLAPLKRRFGNNQLDSFHESGSRAEINVSLSVPFIHCCSHSGTVLSNRLNNGTAATYTTASAWSATFGNMMLSTANIITASSFWDGRIAEVLVYSRELTASERSTVHKYLGKKYGITVA